jgi:hypothetical protein
MTPSERLTKQEHNNARCINETRKEKDKKKRNIGGVDELLH